MPSRHPRCPSIGLNSCNCSTRASSGGRRLLQVAHALDAVVFVFRDELFLLLRAIPRQQRDVDHQFFASRQELVQRRIQRADRNRQPVHRLEDAGKISALQRQQFLQRRAAVFLVVRQNHGAHVRNLLFAEEHVLGAAEPDAFRSERTRLNRIARNVRIGADLHRAMRIGPIHELLQFRIVGAGSRRAQLAFDHAAGRAVERNPVAFFEGLALHPHLASLLVDVDVACAGDAALAHAARHDRSVAGHAAARGENALRDFHAMNVFRRGFGAHQNHRGFLILVHSL